MPSKLHNYVAEQMNDIIREQLKDFKGLLGTRTAQIAKNLYGIGSADIKFPSRIRGKENKKSPDKSYGHRPCKGYPALVIEVAWSQRPLDLPKLAKRYIQGTKGRIRTVIGVNLEYQRTAEVTAGGPASFLVWRAGQPNERGVPSVGQPDERVRGPSVQIHDSKE